MRNVVTILVPLLIAFLPPALATHEQGCIPTRADPSTTYVLDTPDGRRFYLEERADSGETWFLDPPTAPAPPTWGFLFGGGTWVYEETNTINAPDGSMQRGTPGVGKCFPPSPFPCLIIQEDPINDETCGHGADLIFF